MASETVHQKTSGLDVTHPIIHRPDLKPEDVSRILKEALQDGSETEEVDWNVVHAIHLKVRTLAPEGSKDFSLGSQSLISLEHTSSQQELPAVVSITEITQRGRTFLHIPHMEREGIEFPMVGTVRGENLKPMAIVREAARILTNLPTA